MIFIIAIFMILLGRQVPFSRESNLITCTVALQKWQQSYNYVFCDSLKKQHAKVYGQINISLWRMLSETHSSALDVMVYNGIMSLLLRATIAKKTPNIFHAGKASDELSFRCSILLYHLMAYFPGPLNATTRNTLYKTQHYNCAEIWKYHRYSRIHRCSIWYITFDMSLFTVQPTLSRSHKVRSWIHFMYILRTCYGRLNGVSYRTGFFRNFLGFFGFLLHSLRQKLCPNNSSCSNWVKRLPPSRSSISPPSSLVN